LIDKHSYSDIVDILIYGPDLALTYYPSKLVFYWFTSHTLQLLKAVSLPRMIPFQQMDDDLESHLRSNFTDALLKEAIHNAVAYYDNFLGGGDKNIFGKDPPFNVISPTTWFIR